MLQQQQQHPAEAAGSQREILYDHPVGGESSSSKQECSRHAKHFEAPPNTPKPKCRKKTTEKMHLKGGREESRQQLMSKGTRSMRPLRSQYPTNIENIRGALAVKIHIFLLCAYTFPCFPSLYPCCFFKK